MCQVPALLGDLEAALKMAMNQKELEVPWSDHRPVRKKALGRGVAKKLSTQNPGGNVGGDSELIGDMS